MKDTRGPCGLLWHARVGGWDSEVEYAVRPSRLPIACTQATHGGTKRNEHKGKTLTERTCRYMGGSELNWVFFPESMFCRTGTGAGDLGIARRELQHTSCSVGVSKSAKHNSWKVYQCLFSHPVQKVSSVSEKKFCVRNYVELKRELCRIKAGIMSN